MLALALLTLNGRSKWVGASLKNSRPTTVLLLAILALFTWIVATTAIG